MDSHAPDTGPSHAPRPTRRPPKSTPATSPESRTSATSAQSTLTPSPPQKWSAAASLASLSRWLASGSALRTAEARWHLSCWGLSARSDLASFSLRTFLDSCQAPTDATSPRSSPRWMRAGTMQNGRCLTAAIGCRSTESACSLSDVLEAQVPAKYYLRPQALASLLAHAERHAARGHGFGAIMLEQCPHPTKREAQEPS